MFTGIIEKVGTIEQSTPIAGGLRLRIAHDSDDALERGESVAVNGVCLTVLPGATSSFEADLSSETLERTTLGRLRPGARVNLERALRAGSRLGGHIVQGHVDTVGNVIAFETHGGFANARWRFPRDYAPLVVEKGSITVDGISLTIVDPRDDTFGAALIPETLERTNLATTTIGAAVNLEFDSIAKLVRSMLAPYLPERR